MPFKDKTLQKISFPNKLPQTHQISQLLPEIHQTALDVCTGCLCMARSSHSCRESVPLTRSALEQSTNCCVRRVYS